MQKSIKIFFGILAACAVLYPLNYFQLHPLSRSLVHSKVKDVAVKWEKVVFIKTHKTGGSSIQNLFMRYGHEHSLLLLLPQNTNIFGNQQLFRKQFLVKLKDGYKYSILAHHARFNYHDLLSVFNPDDVSGENPTFLTILREPVAAFESLYAYFKCERRFKMNIEELAKFNFSTKPLLNCMNSPRVGHNQMSFDLGVNISDFEDSDVIRKKAVELDQQFDLVMIMERMEESLVLLKNLLNWSTDEVVIFHHNARINKTKRNLTEHQKQVILRWNSADKILYDFFALRFQERIDKFGKHKMSEELAELRQKTDAWYALCVSGESSNKMLDTDLKPCSNLVNGFQLKNRDNQTCVDLTKAEIQFTNYLRNLERQYWLKS